MPADMPAKLKPYIELGFSPEKQIGDEHLGLCPFCLKQKFYVNSLTGLFDCKAGACQKSGGVGRFIEYSLHQFREENPQPYSALAELKSLPVECLQGSEIVYDGRRWWLPVRDAKGRIHTARYFVPKQGNAWFGLALPTGLYGMDTLEESGVVAVCEGEWDWLRLLPEWEGPCLAVPGSGWKDEWTLALADRSVVLAFDNDTAGRNLSHRAIGALAEVAESTYVVKWPDDAKDGYDVKDWFQTGDLEGFLELVIPSEEIGTAPEEKIVLTDYGSEEHPTFEATLDVFKKHLYWTSHLEDTIRVAFATVLGNQIPGKPVWIHMVGPPGSGKSEVLESLDAVHNCYYCTMITEPALISGFKMKDGKDPSIIPKLNGKTFVLKDWTCILGLTEQQKIGVVGILRTAYDGEAKRPYGNGEIKSYKCKFNMLTGTTSAIYREKDATMGARFLHFHGFKGINDLESMEAALSAVRGGGGEKQMKLELAAAAQAFLNTKVNDVPDLPSDLASHIVNIAHITAILRAEVAKELRHERHLYPAENEWPTRISQQLRVVAIALAMMEGGFSSRVKRIVTQIAMDSCTRFHLHIIQVLLAAGDYVEFNTLCEKTDMPLGTMRDRLDDLRTLKAIEISGKVGCMKAVATERIKAFWYASGLPNGRSEMPKIYRPLRLKVETKAPR
jgi:hypothetical protein